MIKKLRPSCRSRMGSTSIMRWDSNAGAGASDAGKSTMEVLQKHLRRFCNLGIVQAFFALMILANFLINIIETCLPEEELAEVADGLWASDMLFTLVFTVELALNILCNFFWPFWRDGWYSFCHPPSPVCVHSFACVSDSCVFSMSHSTCLRTWGSCAWNGCAGTFSTLWL